MINIQDNIAEISVGNISIGSAYVGSQLVWEKTPAVLPYDAQVEWLGSTGSPYLHLPMSVPAGTFFELEFDVLIESVPSSSRCTLFGGNPWRQCEAEYYSSSGTGITLSSYLGNKTANGGIGIIIGDKMHVIFSTTRIVTTNSDGYVTNRNISRALTAEITSFLVFRGYRYSNVFPAKIFSFKVTIGDSLVYDLIPVRKDGVGYMYDKISGNLLGSSGTGSFILGPDVT